MEQLESNSPSGVNELSDKQFICLFCSKQCSNSTDFYNKNSTDLRRVFCNLQINVDNVFKKEAESVLPVCEKCHSVTSKLASLFKDLEVTRMWINHFLRCLMTIIISGEEEHACTNKEVEEDFDKVQLRELIMEKCISTVKSSVPQLKLNRCQLTESAQEAPPEQEDRLSSLSPSPLSQPPLLDHKLELELDTDDVRIFDEDNSMPTSPSPLPSLQSLQEPEPLFSFTVYQKNITSSISKSSSKIATSKPKPNPFWFVKPTLTQQKNSRGRTIRHYYCDFCSKSFNEGNSLKFHAINYHPEQIFNSHKMPHLNSNQFKACCTAIIEDEVTPISNEDNVGSYTTFKCKYCPSTVKLASHSDKRFVQKHLLSFHFDLLVSKLESLQMLQGTNEFEEKVGKLLRKPINSIKILSNQFKRKWKCDACGSGFPNVKRLEWHFQTCGALNGGQRAGMKEYKRHESGSSAPKPSPCDSCGRVLSSGYSLWKHKRLRCLKMLRKKGKNWNGEGGGGGPAKNVKREVIMEEEILPDVNDEAIADDGDVLPKLPQPLEKIVKLEETNVTLSPASSLSAPFPEDDDDGISPNSQSAPPPIQNVEEFFSSVKLPKENCINGVIRRKPFWFIKPTEEKLQNGKIQTKYICPFCPKVVNGYSAIKFHIIGNHPEHIFPFQRLPQVTPQQFSTCCTTILEETAIPISHEDGAGSYTTFECKFCPPEDMIRTRTPDKRVIQVHLIRCHFDALVYKLKKLQESHGSQEFEIKLAKYSDRRMFSKKLGGKVAEFKRKWRCEECQCGFPNKKRLEAHMELHSERRTDLTEKRVKKGVRRQASSVAPAASPCETCGKVFSCGYSLWRHKRNSCVKAAGGSSEIPVNSSDIGGGMNFEDDRMEEEEEEVFTGQIETEDVDQEIVQEVMPERDPLSLD